MKKGNEMRRYPKKCPKCGEYMEPVFDDKWTPGRGTMGNPQIQNHNQLPIGWKCECGYYEEEVNKDG